MRVADLIETLKRAPQDAPVAVVDGDNYEFKCTILSPYVSVDGEFVIQFWN